MVSVLALRYRRLVFALVGALMLIGGVSYFSLPAREDPQITIREAVVTVRFPGQTPDRMERLVTRPIERAARRLKEVDEITSSSLPGLSIVHVEVGETYDDLDQIWDDLRDEIEVARGDLPAGAQAPVVRDDVGDVAVATMALVGDGYTMGEMGEMADHLSDRLYGVAGVKRVAIYGEVPEAVEVTLDEARLATLGLAPGADRGGAVGAQHRHAGRPDRRRRGRAAGRAHGRLRGRGADRRHADRPAERRHAGAARRGRGPAGADRQPARARLRERRARHRARRLDARRRAGARVRPAARGADGRAGRRPARRLPARTGHLAGRRGGAVGVRRHHQRRADDRAGARRRGPDAGAAHGAHRRRDRAHGDARHHRALRDRGRLARAHEPRHAHHRARALRG